LKAPDEQLPAVAELEMANVNESLKTALNDNATVDEVIVQNRELIQEALDNLEIF